MAGTTPNSTNIGRTKRAIAAFTSIFAHPEYSYWAEDWQKIRDALAGEREIKRKGAVYLRPMEGSTDDQYEQYLHRAVFYNMASQTLSGMVGQVFRRPPVIRHLPQPGRVVSRDAGGAEVVIDQGEKLLPALARFAKDGTSHSSFAKTIAAEQIAMGRFLALADVEETPVGKKPQPYAVGYTAENIIDWQIEEVEGFYVPTRVLLREFVRVASSPSADNPWIGDETPRRGKRKRPQTALIRTADGELMPVTSKTPAEQPATGGYTYVTQFRELSLELQEDGSRIYCQKVYKEDPLSKPIKVTYPRVRGNPLRFLPIVFFGAFSNAADCEKPPLLDIVDLNLKHYRTYAELEYGRFYTALPTYYVPGTPDSDSASYHIGPGTVWETTPEGVPGILEYKGEGLKTLERALDEKEQQIAAIGGRMMPGSSKSTSESNQQSSIREANEQSLLLNVITALEEGMTTLMRYWMLFRDVPLQDTALLRYELDTTFLSTALDARAIRAIQQLFNAGNIPVEVFYEAMVRNGVISTTMTLEDFREKMNDPNSFIGQPDAEAMRRGYVSRAQELEQVRLAREAAFQAKELELQDRARTLEEEKFALAQKYGSTTVSASRKLGDPEQAPPTQAEQQQIAVQRKAADNAAKARQTTPAPTPPRRGATDTA